PWWAAARIECRLFAGGKFTGVVVRQDERWPTMWRVCRGDTVSDMVNLSRAKDAAQVWAKLGGRELGPEWRAGSRDGASRRSAFAERVVGDEGHALADSPTALPGAGAD